MANKGAILITLLALYWLIGGCYPGSSGDDQTDSGPRVIRTMFDDGEPLVCPEEVVIEPGLPLIRRLTNEEYRNTIVDLLNVELNDQVRSLPMESYVDGFLNTARGLTVSHRHIEQYARLARYVADTLSLDQEPYRQAMGCTISDQQCLSDFIRSLGLRLFRRPLDTLEIDAYRTIFDVVDGDAEPIDVGLRLVTEAMLQAPQFLYRIENQSFATNSPAMVNNDDNVDVEDAMTVSIRPLTDYEMASKLSYFIWHSAPDPSLLLRAAQGKLHTDEDIEDAIRTMLDDARAGRAFRSYISQWLRFDELETLERSENYYPEFSQSLVDDMKEETFRMLESVLLHSQSDMMEIFRAKHTFVSPQLATLYGFDIGDREGFQRFDFSDTNERIGILTQASILTATTEHDETSPVKRGHFIRQKFLCQTLPPPPSNFALEAAPSTEGLGNRERLEAHSTQAQCAFCHRFMDPIGFGLENYDAIGSKRTHDLYGNAVDTSGQLLIGQTIDEFQGVSQLSELLAQSERVEYCMVEQVYQYAMGRMPVDYDLCTLQTIQKVFHERGRTYKDLILAVATSDAFRHVRAY